MGPSFLTEMRHKNWKYSGIKEGECCLFFFRLGPFDVFDFEFGKHFEQKLTTSNGPLFLELKASSRPNLSAPPKWVYSMLSILSGIQRGGNAASFFQNILGAFDVVDLAFRNILDKQLTSKGPKLEWTQKTSKTSNGPKCSAPKVGPTMFSILPFHRQGNERHKNENIDFVSPSEVNVDTKITTSNGPRIWTQNWEHRMDPMFLGKLGSIWCSWSCQLIKKLGHTIESNCLNISCLVSCFLANLYMLTNKWLTSCLELQMQVQFPTPNQRNSPKS